MALPQMPIVTRDPRLELLDGVDFTPEELSGTLRDLRRYSRIGSGAPSILRALGALAKEAEPGRRLTLLDVGAGDGWPAGWIRDRWAALAAGEEPLVVASDLRERLLASGASEDLALCAADARGLPFPDASVDLAWSSLLVHHLDEPGIVASLAEMRRVTRIGFVVSDLRRSSLALAAVWLLTRLTSRNRLTLNDGPLSVRRSLKADEVRALATKAGLKPRSGGQGNGFTLRRLGAARWLLVHRNAF